MYDTIDYETLCKLVAARGYSDRQFSKLLWGEKTHLNLKYFIQKPDIRVSNLIKMSRILGCSLESFFLKEEELTDIKADNKATDFVLTQLQKENQSLKKLLKERDIRITELKETNDQLWKRLDNFISNGFEAKI